MRRNAAVDHGDPDPLTGERRQRVAPDWEGVNHRRVCRCQCGRVERRIGKPDGSVVDEAGDVRVGAEVVDERGCELDGDPVSDRDTHRAFQTRPPQIGLQDV